MRDYNYYKSRLKDFGFPHACLDLELFKKNILTNLNRAGDKKIRIASKSIRCVEAMRIIFESNDQFQGIMTYHGNEALFLIEQGFDNLLMGYPIVDKQLLRSIGEKISIGNYVCLMVDSLDQISIVNEIGKELNVKFPICLDLDLSDDYPGLHFGVWRSSIQSIKDLESILPSIKKMAFIKLDGLMGYEAQVAGVGDSTPGGGIKNALIRSLKKKSIKNINKNRKEAVELIESHGINLNIVNGGGTGSLESTKLEACVTEVTVGSGFYNSHLFDYYKNFQLQAALFYGVQIVRKPTPNIYTCHGGGFIASGSTEATKAPIVHLPENGSLDKLEGAGEVQTPIRFNNLNEELQIGDPVYFRHAKAGELCERFNKIIFLDSDSHREVDTYRGQGVSFG